MVATFFPISLTHSFSHQARKSMTSKFKQKIDMYLSAIITPTNQRKQHSDTRRALHYIDRTRKQMNLDKAR